MLTRRIQLSPKSLSTIIFFIQVPKRTGKGLSNPKRLFSASISYTDIPDPCVFLKAKYLSAQVPGTNSIKVKTIKLTINSVMTAITALVNVNCIKFIIVILLIQYMKLLQINKAAINYCRFKNNLNIETNQPNTTAVVNMEKFCNNYRMQL